MTDEQARNQALDELAGGLLGMSNPTLEVLAAEDPGPLGAAAGRERVRRQRVREARAMDDTALAAAARAEDRELAAAARHEAERRAADRVQAAAETVLTAAVEAARRIDAAVVELLAERVRTVAPAIAARFGTGLPLHDAAADAALRAGWAADVARHAELDPALAERVIQAIQGLCRRQAEAELGRG